MWLSLKSICKPAKDNIPVESWVENELLIHKSRKANDLQSYEKLFGHIKNEIKANLKSEVTSSLYKIGKNLTPGY